MIAATSKDRKILASSDASVDEKLKYGLYYDRYKKFGVGGVAGGGLLTVETNWNPNTKKNKYLRLKIGDQTVVILNEHLRSILKILTPFSEWEDLMSHSRRFYQTRKKILKVVTSKAYRRGEEIYLNVDCPEVLVR